MEVIGESTGVGQQVVNCDFSGGIARLWIYCVTTHKDFAVGKPWNPVRYRIFELK